MALYRFSDKGARQGENQGEYGKSFHQDRLGLSTSCAFATSHAEDVRYTQRRPSILGETFWDSYLPANSSLHITRKCTIHRAHIDRVLMKVAIHQPQYHPWINYYIKIAKADIFVFLDDVQFQKNGLQNRNKIKMTIVKSIHIYCWVYNFTFGCNPNRVVD